MDKFLLNLFSFIKIFIIYNDRIYTQKYWAYNNGKKNIYLYYNSINKFIYSFLLYCLIKLQTIDSITKQKKKINTV